MKKYKTYILPALIVLVLLFITPKLIDWLVSISSPFGFIKPKDRNTWIGFYGAIIGGGITLGGEWWTLNKQDKRRKEELALQ